MRSQSRRTSCLVIMLAVAAAGIASSPTHAQPPCEPGGLFAPHLQFPVGAYPIEAAVGDFNADGIPDIAVVNFEGNDISILRGTGSTTWDAAVSVPAAMPSSIVAADFNEDGMPDLAVTQFGTNELLVLRATGPFAFVADRTYPVGPEPRSVAIGDFDEDGITDLVVAAGSVYVLLGRGVDDRGNGTFDDPVSYPAMSAWGVATGDFDGDGVTDLSVAGLNYEIAILLGLGSLGQGDGTFVHHRSVPVSGGQRTITVGDFNGDGITDAAAVGSSLWVLLGQGPDDGGQLQYRVDTYPSTGGFNGVASLRIDDDAILDLAVTDGALNRVGIWRGSASGSFSSLGGYAVGRAPVGILTHDLNRDLIGDLLVANSTGSISVLLGRCGGPPPPPPPLPPVISSFSPTGGVIGDAVTLFGSELDDVTAVEFAGTSAPIRAQSFDRLETEVPAGASTGLITVRSPAGTASTGTAFFVGERPVITSALPDSGVQGDTITIVGDHFTSATRVAFGPASDAAFTVVTDERIEAVVDPLAQTGPISVTTPAAVSTSTFSFRVSPLHRAPRNVRVRDVPDDQGGRVVVTWERSDLDRRRPDALVGYRIWRRAPATQASREGYGPASLDSMGPPDGFWEALATLAPSGLSAYAYVAPTTQDSMAGSHPHTAFFVQAVMPDPFLFYASEVDSGYSVDNLAPQQPPSFIAQYLPVGVGLHWEPSAETDLFGYRLYRGNDPGFVPSAANLIVARADTGYFDPSGDARHSYKLSALDVHGNESRFALVTPHGSHRGLVSLKRAVAEADRVSLEWDASANPGMDAHLERHEPGSGWSRMRSVWADARGRILHEDRDVTPGARYGYRLRVRDGAADVFTGETWVDVPLFSLRLSGIHPNPGVGSTLEVRFTLAGTEPAALDLLDVQGRRVHSTPIAGPAPGRHAVRIEPGQPLAPGIYLVRLTQGHKRVSGKAVIVP